MRELLTIGEAAGLVGVTTKAIRHYHRVGLLSEPPRSEAGYRLYSAGDLIRMRRIRRLQDLGLSLRRIREVIGETDDSGSLRMVLVELLSKVEADISALECRKRHIQEALAREETDELADSSPTFERMRLENGCGLPEMSPEALDQEKRLWAAFDAFDWPDGYAEKRNAVTHHYVKNPVAQEEMVRLSERLAALSGAEVDAPEVQTLARDTARHFREHQIPGTKEVSAQAEGPMDLAFDGIMTRELSPAQRRCMELIRELMEGVADRGGAS